MAYFDKKQDNVSSAGDPFADFDRELADLRSALAALDDDAPATQSEPSANRPRETDPPTAEEAADREGPAAGSEAPDEKPEKGREGKEPEPAQRTANTDNTPSRKGKKPKKKRSRFLTALIVLVLVIALVVGSAFAVKTFAPKSSFLYRAYAGVYRLICPEEEEEPTVQETKTVVISDSVIGDVEIEAVQGAKLNTYTAENFTTDDSGVPAYYENGKKISHLGADLSEFQGEVDFAAMKAAGVEFVILRIGGRSYGEEGTLYPDSAFDSNYEKAKAAGLKVGAYFFSQAISAEDAKEEASYALELLGSKTLDYPIAFDWENIAEDTARTDHITGDQLTAIAEAFCDTVTAGGYQAIVYSNTQQMFVMYDFETMKNYDFWLADYRDVPNMYYKFDMWQYTKDGSIDGVEGTVDLNLSFTDFT